MVIAKLVFCFPALVLDPSTTNSVVLLFSYFSLWILLPTCVTGTYYNCKSVLGLKTKRPVQKVSRPPLEENNKSACDEYCPMKFPYDKGSFA